MADFASEGGHWYLPDGSAFYTCKGANGAERAVTLRDARKVNAVPGVTTIIRCAAAPALERWKLGKLALAMATLPRLPGEAEDAFIVRAMEDARKEAKDAADRGTVIHGVIERSYRGETIEAEHAPWAQAARAAIRLTCGEQRWLPERSVASPLGYGTKIDLHSPEWVIDHKGKDALDPASVELWDEHFMQLAAGRHALRIPKAKCGILFFNRHEPQAMLREVPEESLAKGLRCFMALLDYWKNKNNYFPSWKSE